MAKTRTNVAQVLSFGLCPTSSGQPQQTSLRGPEDLAVACCRSPLVERHAPPCRALGTSAQAITKGRFAPPEASCQPENGNAARPVPHEHGPGSCGRWAHRSPWPRVCPQPAPSANRGPCEDTTTARTSAGRDGAPGREHLGWERGEVRDVSHRAVHRARAARLLLGMRQTCA